ncbi:Transmembrane domain-containing protein [Spironucleus salmonicida]|uniref:Transmembrane domain-containing protein n=1 Tax=Spironucleus salmonicida TaxID=348837 RepID=V6LQQ1_9EUKA|nr:Transmembrane domain-containing protein [Spironucleus salmonicida]|eukprot:EST46910.1 Transmembrane domain-containing protein [Spironucleus salmonicida]
MNNYQLNQETTVLAKRKLHYIPLLVLKQIIPLSISAYVCFLFLYRIFTSEFQLGPPSIKKYDMLIFLSNVGVNELNPGIVGTDLPASYVMTTQPQKNVLKLSIPTAFTPQFPLVQFGQPYYLKVFIQIESFFGTKIENIQEFDIQVTNANSNISNICKLVSSGHHQNIIQPTFTDIDPSVYNDTTKFLPEQSVFNQTCVTDVKPATAGLVVDFVFNFMPGKLIPTNTIVIMFIFTGLCFSVIVYFGTYMLLNCIYKKIFIFARIM